MASKLGVTALYVTPHTQESGGPLTPRTPQDRRHWGDIFSGKAFQVAGPACENARSPNFVRSRSRL